MNAASNGKDAQLPPPARLWELSDDRILAGKQLVMRLERLSADSHWAHQASGLRGALLRFLDEIDCQTELSPQAAARLDQLIQRGQLILVNAARAIRTPETQLD